MMLSGSMRAVTVGAFCARTAAPARSSAIAKKSFHRCLNSFNSSAT